MIFSLAVKHYDWWKNCIYSFILLFRAVKLVFFFDRLRRLRDRAERGDDASDDDDDEDDDDLAVSTIIAIYLE